MTDILSIALVATPGLAGWQVAAACVFGVCLIGFIVSGLGLLRGKR